MATTTTNPTPTTEPVTGPQPKAPTPLEHPEIYYNLIWRVPPLVVTTQEEKDALDPNEWTQDPAHMPVAAKAHWPKLYYNINVAPVIVGSEEEAKALSGMWAEFKIPVDLAKSAEATAQDAANPPASESSTPQ